MDVAHLLFIKREGAVPPELAVDVSQTLVRCPWRVGTFTSPSSSTKLVYQNKVVGVKSMFCLLGWPMSRLTLPPSLSENHFKTLVGNIISTPMMGGVLAAVFGSIQVGPLDLRRRK